VKPGNYTVQVYDGASADRTEVQIKNETEKRTLTNVDRLRSRISELEDKVEELRDNRSELNVTVNRLEEKRDRLQRQVERGDEGPAESREENRTDGDSVGNTSEDGEKQSLPGFGPIVALLALVLTALYLARHGTE